MYIDIHQNQLVRAKKYEMERPIQQPIPDIPCNAELVDRLLSHSPIAMVVADRNRKTRYVNRKFTALFGYSIEDVPTIDEWWSVAYPDEQYRNHIRQEWLDRVSRADREQKEIEPLQALVSCRDGSRRNILFRYSSLGDGGLVTLEDMTEQFSYEERLLKKAQIIEQIPQAVISLNPEGIITGWNGGAEKLFGIDRSEILGADLSVLCLPEDYDSLRKIIGEVCDSHYACNVEMLLERKNHDFFMSFLSFSPLRNSRGDCNGLIMCVMDLSKVKAAEQSVRLAGRIFENIHEGIMITDARGIIRSVNPGFTRITEFGADEVIGQSSQILQSDRHDGVFYRGMLRDLLRFGYWEGEIWNRRKSGEAYPERMTVSAVRDGYGRTTEYIVVFFDLSELKQSQAKLEYQANHDALTGLANRTLFMDRLKHAIERRGRNGGKLAVILFDIDNIKMINDTLGYPIGDMLLQRIAEILKKQVRLGDTISRVGSDEFAIMLESFASEEQVWHVVHRIKGDIARSHNIAGRDIHIGISAGIAIYPEDGNEPEILLQNADLAMIQAKERGKNAVRHFTPILNEKANRRMQMEIDLRQAVTGDQIVPFCQPKIDLITGQVAGWEALARWRKSADEMVLPDEFIPVAEYSDLINEIGMMMLEKSCRINKEWNDQVMSPLTVAVNVSPRQFEEVNFDTVVNDILDITRLPANLLEVEITESMLIKDHNNSLALMKRLAERGVRIAIDDFGTGYSSLKSLKNYPIHSLKIDRNFIRDLQRNRKDRSIAAAIISIARDLNLQVVAEGVENREQIEFLMERGCDYAQGFYYSRPVDTEVARNNLKKKFSLNGEIS